MSNRRSSPLHRWPRTRLTEVLRLDFPIVQGPFGSGLSSVELAATVSNAGGLGSFGMQHLDPRGIELTIADLRARTDRSFAANLWVSTHDMPEAEMTDQRWAAAVRAMRPLYDRFEVDPPARPDCFAHPFDDLVEAVLRACPPVLSWVYGIPESGVLDALRERGIVTVGTAITPDEAVALDEAGVDVIVASGAEAGGHRVAFLDSPERSLMGTMALIPIVANEVRAPIIAASGIADARGIVAALALGADGVQIGTAFLATDQSGATRPHRDALHSPAARRTGLTRAFTGRLARGIRNEMFEELVTGDPRVEPYPYQAALMRPFRDSPHPEATQAVALWAGQAAPLLREHDAAMLVATLRSETTELLSPIIGVSEE